MPQGIVIAVKPADKNYNQQKAFIGYCSRQPEKCSRNKIDTVVPYEGKNVDEVRGMSGKKVNFKLEDEEVTLKFPFKVVDKPTIDEEQEEIIKNIPLKATLLISLLLSAVAFFSAKR